MTNFDKVMSATSDLELFRILNHKRNSYTTEAILSAEKEYEKRNFSEDELENFRRNIAEEENRESQKKLKRSLLDQKIRNSINLAIPTEKGSTPKNIFSFAIFLTLVYLYYFLTSFSYLWFIISESATDFNLLTIEFIAPYLLFPIGIFGLLKTRKFGWYLTCGLLTYYFITTIFSYVLQYKMSMDYGDGGLSLFIDDFYAVPAIGAIIINLLVIGGFIFFLFRQGVLIHFSLNKNAGINFIAVLAAISTILWWWIY